MVRKGRVNNICPVCRNSNVDSMLKEADESLLRYNKKLKKYIKNLKKEKK
jgi:hypothetical protein